MDTQTAPTAHVLIVEDEPRLAAVLGEYLHAAGYLHHWVADGAQAIEAFRAQAPDLLLLDLMLPNRDGLDICRELRSLSAVPVIMVTARTQQIDRLLGLEIGDDDDICKPFSPREVIARVRAVLRRHRQDSESAPTHGLIIDEATCRASVAGRDLDLTQLEFRLLRTLCASPGRVYSREQLMDRVYVDHRIVTDRTVDSHIKNVRRKLADVGGEEWVRSLYGAGYRFELWVWIGEVEALGLMPLRRGNHAASAGRSPSACQPPRPGWPPSPSALHCASHSKIDVSDLLAGLRYLPERADARALVEHDRILGARSNTLAMARIDRPVSYNACRRYRSGRSRRLDDLSNATWRGEVAQVRSPGSRHTHWWCDPELKPQVQTAPSR